MRYLTILLSAFLATSAHAQVRAIMEGVPSTNNVISITTGTAASPTDKRVYIATRTYSGGIANVGLASSSNVVVSNDGTNKCVLYSSGSVTCLSVRGDGTGVTNVAAVTATALAANPTDCASGNFANAINASGNLTCSADGSALTGIPSTSSIVGVYLPLTGGTLGTNSSDPTAYTLSVSSGYTLLDTYTESISTMGASSSIPASTIYWSTASWVEITLTNSPTFAFANAKEGQCLNLFLKQDGTGSRTVTWPTISWPGGVAPTLTTTANKVDIIVVCLKSAVYYGFTGGLNY